MKDQVAEAAKDWLSMVLLGMGFTLHPYEWIGGILLGMGAATFAWQIDKRRSVERDLRAVGVVLGGSFLASHIASLIVQAYAPTFPVTLAMIAAGFFSSYIARIALRMAGLVEDRSDRILDGTIDRFLPHNKGEDDK